jgi:hypothetical protein
MRRALVVAMVALSSSAAALPRSLGAVKPLAHKEAQKMAAWAPGPSPAPTPVPESWMPGQKCVVGPCSSCPCPCPPRTPRVGV